MDRLIIDINKGIISPNNTYATQTDNKCRTIPVTIVNGDARVNLTNKIVRLAAINKDKLKSITIITVTNPIQGEFNINLEGALVSKEGTINMQLGIFDDSGYLMHTCQFTQYINQSLFEIIAPSMQESNEFKEVLDGLKKIQDWDNYFKDITPNLEEKYTTRLNDLNTNVNQVKSQLDDKANQTDLLNKADKTYVDNKVATISSGTPLFASSVAGMTDTTKNYVNTTDGYIYIHNGTTFVKSTVQYQSTGIADKSVTPEKMTDNGLVALLEYQTKPINFDFTNNKIIIYSNTVLLLKKQRIVITTTDTQLDISSLTSGLMYGMYYNTSINSFVFKNTGEIGAGQVSNDMILIASFNKLLKSVNCMSSFAINDSSVIDTSAFNGYYIGQKETFTFDFIRKQIRIKPWMGAIIYKNTRYSISSEQVIDISSLAASYYALSFNTISNQIGFTQLGVEKPSRDNIIFACFSPTRLEVYNLPLCNIIGDINSDRYILQDEIKGYYNSKNYDDLTGGFPKEINKMKVDDLYALYDDLVARFPQYVTKTELGKVDTQLPTTLETQISVYRYDFKPTRAIGKKSKFPKAIITSGTHPEYTAVWSLYQLMKDLCENDGSNEYIDLLRWNVHFVIVPLVNPCAYNTGNRTNIKGVDINRNFPANWTLTQPGTHYSSTAPLDQKESIIIHNLLTTETDVLLHFDYHNFDVNDGYKFCLLSKLRFMTHIGQELISKLTRKWKKEIGFIDKADDKFIGYTGDNVGGTLSEYATSLGYNSYTLEITQQFFDEPDTHINSSNVLKYGQEAFVNTILQTIRCLVDRN